MALPDVVSKSFFLGLFLLCSKICILSTHAQQDPSTPASLLRKTASEPSTPAAPDEQDQRQEQRPSSSSVSSESARPPRRDQHDPSQGGIVGRVFRSLFAQLLGEQKLSPADGRSSLRPLAGDNFRSETRPARETRRRSPQRGGRRKRHHHAHDFHPAPAQTTTESRRTLVGTEPTSHHQDQPNWAVESSISLKEQKGSTGILLLFEPAVENEGTCGNGREISSREECLHAGYALIEQTRVFPPASDIRKQATALIHSSWSASNHTSFPTHWGTGVRACLLLQGSDSGANHADIVRRGIIHQADRPLASAPAGGGYGGGSSPISGGLFGSSTTTAAFEAERRDVIRAFGLAGRLMCRREAVWIDRAAEIREREMTVVHAQQPDLLFEGQFFVARCGRRGLSRSTRLCCGYGARFFREYVDAT